MEKQTLPLISFIVPVWGDAHTIERMIDSVMDQDYPEIELIASVDGCKESEKAVKRIVARYKDDKRRVTAIYAKKNQGACVARNEGAKLAKGEYLSFLPADAWLLPGVVRTWMNQLIEHPDYDFLYGGYRFVEKTMTVDELKEYAKEEELEVEEYAKKYGFRRQSNGSFIIQPAQDYLSQPFDPYMLECGNFIDGSFPIKATTFWEAGGWDPAIKSLQDWDFWLTVVKKLGKKGIFIQDIFFETEYPHKGGLSDDSHRNWIARTEQIKEKQGIPDRKICVTSVGAPFHGKMTARLLDADFKDMPSFKPHKYEMVYQLGFFPSIADVCAQAFVGAKGKKVIHWIGSDIWQLQQMDYMHKKMLLEWFNNNIDEHLCEAKFTQKELKELGVNAKVVPLPPRFFYKANPLPEKFTVAVYQPMGNKSFYLPNVMKRVAELMPDVQFKFFGDPTAVGRLNNVEFVGHVTDMQKLIDGSSMILRYPIHDGLPLSVIEFYQQGAMLL